MRSRRVNFLLSALCLHYPSDRFLTTDFVFIGRENLYKSAMKYYTPSQDEDLGYLLAQILEHLHLWILSSSKRKCRPVGPLYVG